MISIISPAWWCIFIFGIFIGSTQPGLSANWEICDLKVKVLKTPPDSNQMHTEVLSIRPKGDAECPKQSEYLNFMPESVDYQTMILRRNWPKPNKIVSIRYRYLDGECKERGPCRIKHYSLITK